jgi:hypothetical protein
VIPAEPPGRFILHYTCASGDEYYRETPDNVGDVERLLEGDKMTAELLLGDPIVDGELIEMSPAQFERIPHDHPEWEKFLGEKWKIVDAEGEEEEK